MFARCLFAVGLCGVFATGADAQILGRRARASSAPTYVPAPAAGGIYRSAPGWIETLPPQAPLNNCPCDSSPSSGNCNDVCTQPPRIYPNNINCDPEKKCVDIPYTITPINQPDCVKIPFYGPAVPFQAEVLVPVLTETCREEIKFKTIRIPYPCCTIEVCIPCEKCEIKTKSCQLVLKKVDLEAYRRQDKTIDVYVLKVPGMPTKYVQRQKLTEPEYKLAFPGAALPTYP